MTVWWARAAEDVRGWRGVSWVGQDAVMSEDQEGRTPQRGVVSEGVVAVQRHQRGRGWCDGASTGR